jgi:hypothetical protein
LHYGFIFDIVAVFNTIYTKGTQMYTITPAAYIFTHSYLNTMQQGIQSLHVIGEFIANSTRDDKSWEDVVYWAKNDKTVRILNAGGGTAHEIAYRTAVDLSEKYNLPFSEFVEPDCYNQITAFGFIVTPELVYNISVERGRSAYESDIDIDSHAVVQFLKHFPSAR